MIGFIIVIVVLAVVIPLVIAQQKKIAQIWASSARQLGLTFRDGGAFGRPTIRGQIEGMQVVADTFSRGSGKNSTTYTRVRARFPQTLGLGLRLEREGFLSGVTKLFGAQDIQVGDVVFDNNMLIKGRSDHAIRQFLTPTRRMRIQRFMVRRPETVIDDEGVECVQRGVISQQSELVSMIQTTVRLAWHLAEDRAENESLEKAMKLRNEGDPEAAMEIIEAAVVKRAEPPNKVAAPPIAFIREPVEERRMHAELKYLAGKREEAHQAFQKVHADDPDDDEIVDWIAATKPAEATTQTSAGNEVEVVTGDTPPSQTAPEEIKSTERPVDLTQKSFCDDLFGDSSRSLDINRRFEQQFQGKVVHWQGELLKIERNYSALVFAASDGAKATLKIDERPSLYYGTDKVLAIVHLPESALEELKPQVGQTLGFSGKLVKTDGLMRNVYLDHGSVGVERQ